jgi:hypothetical protein
MALEILRCVDASKPVNHAFHHDLESFVYVLIYAVMKKETADVKGEQSRGQISAEKRNELKRLYQSMMIILTSAFGQGSLNLIKSARSDIHQSWKDYMDSSKGSYDTTCLHEAISDLLEHVKMQNFEPPVARLEKRRRTSESITTDYRRPVNVMLASKLREILKYAIEDEKRELGDETPDSDPDDSGENGDEDGDD